MGTSRASRSPEASSLRTAGRSSRPSGFRRRWKRPPDGTPHPAGAQGQDDAPSRLRLPARRGDPASAEGRPRCGARGPGV